MTIMTFDYCPITGLKYYTREVKIKRPKPFKLHSITKSTSSMLGDISQLKLLRNMGTNNSCTQFVSHYGSALDR